VLVNDFLADHCNSVILAGPGWGKTTFLHAVFMYFLGTANTLPFLITLRREESIADLQKLVGDAERIKAQRSEGRLLLLVDGYDEISPEARKTVSELLTKFSSSNVGNFYLTCRTYYDVYDLAARQVSISEFKREDQVRFASAFFRAYGTKANGEQTIKEL